MKGSFKIAKYRLERLARISHDEHSSTKDTNFLILMRKEEKQYILFSMIMDGSFRNMKVSPLLHYLTLNMKNLVIND